MSKAWKLVYHCAARHHERAAYHYKEAAKYEEAGEHEKAAHHAYIAHGTLNMRLIAMLKRRNCMPITSCMSNTAKAL